MMDDRFSNDHGEKERGVVEAGLDPNPNTD
jgi:hypothetical protein